MIANGSAPRIPEIPPGCRLSDRHAEYLEARGVSRATAEAAGCYTAARPSEIPPAFASYQRRRAPALVVPHASPDGQSVGWQKRDDYPGKDNKGRVAKWVSPKGGTPRLSVHPWTADEAITGTGALWLPEGITRMLALAQLGIPAVGYAGCWAWRKDKNPLGCFDHLNLDGRLVYDIPDADYRVNDKVQMALGLRVAFLESRGARVLVVSVPAVNGDEHAGLDDYIAAGGDLEALARDARPFEPVDVGRERLTKDEQLRCGVEALRRNADALASRGLGECSALAVARYMAETAAPEHGKVRADGVKVRPSVRQIAAAVRVGLGTVKRALDYLEGEGVGFLKTLERAKGTRPASYLLMCDPSGGGREFVEHIEGSGVMEKESLEHGAKGGTSLYQRDSSPSVPQTRGGAGRSEKVPALRNSKVVHAFERRDGRRVVVDSQFYWRYGKKREAMMRHVLEAGAADEAELLEKFGSKSARLRDFRRTWITPVVEDEVWTRDGSVIAPAHDWRGALERVQARTDEDGDTRRQIEKYRRQRAAYRERLEAERRGEVAEPEPAPELAGDKEKTRRKYADLAERDAGRLEAERRAELAPAVAFVRRTFANLEVARLGLLEDLWRDEGGLRWHLRRALREMGCTPKQRAEHPGEWFVYPPATWPEPGSDGRTPKKAPPIDAPGPDDNTDKRGDSAVVPMSKRVKESGPENLTKPDTGDPSDVFRNAPHASRGLLTNVEPTDAPRKLPPKVAGIYTHGPECACWICEDEPAEIVPAGIGASA